MKVDDLILNADDLTSTLVQSFAEITLADGTKVDVVLAVSGSRFELWPEDMRGKLAIDLKPLFDHAVAKLEEMEK